MVFLLKNFPIFFNFQSVLRMPGNGLMTVVVAGTTTTLTTTQPSMQRTEMAIRGSGKRWSSTKFFETFSSKIPLNPFRELKVWILELKNEYFVVFFVILGTN